MRCFVLMLLLLGVQVCFSQKSGRESDRDEEDTLKTAKSDYDEVVVIGTRTAERILDIPYSVFIVDKKELGYGKKVSAKDVLADVPGLFLQSRYGNHDLRISIRGFGTRSNSGIRGVRILQDGIPESEPDGESVIDAVDFTSLGGVEVVKGNLSSLYANAPGGIINFKSDLYFPQSYVATTNQIGKYGYRQNGFKIGILRDNDTRFLLSYNYRNLDGYRQHSAEYQHLLNAVYENYTQKSTLTVSGNYVNGFMQLPGPLTKEEYDADPFQASPIGLAYNFRRNARKGRLGVKYKTSFGQDDSFEFGVTGYGGIKESESAAIEAYTLSTRYSVGTLVSLTNKAELLGRKNILTVGMDYAYQSGPIREFENLFGNQGFSIQNEYNSTLSNVGFYFLDHFNLIDETFDVFASGRFDKNVYSNDIAFPALLTDTVRSFQKFAPKIGLNFKLTPAIALYTSYGLGYDFPALSELLNDHFTSNLKYSLNPDLDVQKSNSFELGIKGSILRPDEEILKKLFFEVTYFNYIIKDEIVPFVINQKTYFRNAARTNRAGLEMGMKSKPLKGVEFTVNYTYTNFKYGDNNAHVRLVSGDTAVNFSGNFVPSVPRTILNLILNYEFEVTEEVEGLLLWDCDYIGNMSVDDANSATSSGYFYGNIMAGANVSLENVNAVFFVGMNNIFDKRYVGFLNVNDSNGRYFETGEPRTVYAGLNVSYKF